MNLFQILAVAAVLLLSTWTVRTAFRGQMRKRIALFWLLVWLGSGTTIVWPRATVVVANRLGIGRGADLVLYVSVVVTMAGFFYVYTRFRRMDTQLTQLVRALAIQNARKPEPTNTPKQPSAH